jgi:hypothetical protein
MDDMDVTDRSNELPTKSMSCAIARQGTLSTWLSITALSPIR